MSAADAAPLPRLGEAFFDVRGESRSMRLSWYAETGVAVFSIWQGDMCTGTFRLPLTDLPRMIEILQHGPAGHGPAGRGWDRRAEGDRGPGQSLPLENGRDPVTEQAVSSFLHDLPSDGQHRPAHSGVAPSPQSGDGDGRSFPDGAFDDHRCDGPSSGRYSWPGQSPVSPRSNGYSLQQHSPGSYPDGSAAAGSYPPDPCPARDPSPASSPAGSYWLDGHSADSYPGGAHPHGSSAGHSASAYESDRPADNRPAARFPDNYSQQPPRYSPASAGPAKSSAAAGEFGAAPGGGSTVPGYRDGPAFPRSASAGYHDDTNTDAYPDAERPAYAALLHANTAAAGTGSANYPSGPAGPDYRFPADDAPSDSWAEIPAVSTAETDAYQQHVPATESFPYRQPPAHQAQDQRHARSRSPIV
ncbi:MAG: hypothetical protein ACLPUO_03050 [Streptosporangiaceae bacterium]|jgi:hypothetical protein